MRITLNHITPLLAVGAAAIAIAAAPSAVAEQPCTNLGGSKTICQSPRQCSDQRRASRAICAAISLLGRQLAFSSWRPSRVAVTGPPALPR